MEEIWKRNRKKEKITFHGIPKFFVLKLPQNSISFSTFLFLFFVFFRLIQYLKLKDLELVDNLRRRETIKIKITAKKKTDHNRKKKKKITIVLWTFSILNYLNLPVG